MEILPDVEARIDGAGEMYVNLSANSRSLGSTMSVKCKP